MQNTASILAVSVLALCPVPGRTQSAPRAGDEWSRVQALSRGALVHVSAVHGGLCRVTAVDETALHCEPAGTAEKTFAREEIRSVKLSRRDTSAGAMGAIGAGVGVAATALISKAGGLNGSAKGGVWAGSAGLGALICAPIGYFGDTFRGPVVYRSPARDRARRRGPAEASNVAAPPPQ